MIKYLMMIIICLTLVLNISAQEKKLTGEGGAMFNGTMISYKSGDDSVQAYLSMPKDKGKVPGVILIHEWWGLNDWVKKNADEFANKGYAAIAVDLYRGKVTSDPGDAHEYRRALEQQQGVNDIIAAYKYLMSIDNVDSANIGAIGWCMGGTYSLQSAINIPDLKASVVAYGGLTKDPELLGKINCPVLGINGEEDKGITPENVKDFEAVMKKQDKDITIKEYPKAGHAFMNDINNKTGYKKESAEDAWKEIWSFFDKHLKSGENKKE